MGFFSFFSKEKKESLDKGLEKTKEGFFSKIAKAIVGKSTVDAEVLDNLEEVLITSDVGVETTIKIIKRIEEKELSVVKPDKKLSFFNIAINTKDELMSLMITKGIIKIATDFYVNAKVGRLKSNIQRLEKRTDSISNLLNQQTYSATEDARLLLNVNPSDINAPVYSEISQRDKMVLTTIYAELMKNLEVSKAALIQETPTVQIVDQTGFPLERIETKWYEGILLGAILSLLTITSLLLFREKD
jgi:hypothetical protein